MKPKYFGILNWYIEIFETYNLVLQDLSGNQVNMVTSLQIPPLIPDLLLYSVPSNRPQQIEPQQFEPQQMEPQQFEPQQMGVPQQMEVPQQFEPQQMEPQQVEPQQMDSQQVEPLPHSPSPPCSGINLEDFQLPFSPSPTWDTNDSEDFQSESSLEDEDLKSMALQDTIGKYPY